MLQESTRNLLLDRLTLKTEKKKAIQSKIDSKGIYQEYYNFEMLMVDREIETIRETIIHDEIQ